MRLSIIYSNFKRILQAIEEESYEDYKVPYMQTRKYGLPAEMFGGG